MTSSSGAYRNSGDLSRVPHAIGWVTLGLGGRVENHQAGSRAAASDTTRGVNPPFGHRWFAQIVEAAGSGAELVPVPGGALPADLALTAAPAQHLLFSVARARALLNCDAGEPTERVAESVRWHLAHPPADSTRTDVGAAGEAA